jgi:hypothetical protein
MSLVEAVDEKAAVVCAMAGHRVSHVRRVASMPGPPASHMSYLYKECCLLSDCEQPVLQ